MLMRFQSFAFRSFSFRDVAGRIAFALTLAFALAPSLAAQPAKPNPKAAAASAKPAAPANQPPESATSARMMAFMHEGKAPHARSLGAGYLNLHPGTPRTIEHCHILIAFAYADLMLDHRDEAKQALGVFDKGCKHTAVRDDYRAEATRVRRVLNGEALSTVYPR